MNRFKLGTAVALSLGLAGCGVSSQTPVQPSTATNTASKLTPQRCLPDEPCGPPRPLCDPNDPNDPTCLPPPPPPTGKNLRVKITMTYVNSKDTEDVAGGFLGLGAGVDEFYTMGGVQISPENSNIGVRKGFVTDIFSAKSGDSYSPNQQVFNAVIAPDTRFVFEYAGYDEDMGKDAPTMAAISGVVGVGVAATTVAGGCAATAFVGCGIAVAVFGAASGIMALDKDDKLGTGTIDLAVLRKNQYSTQYYKTHLGDCSGFMSSCDYDVVHKVEIIPTDDLVTPL